MSLSDKPILTVLRATAVIYAIYLPIALWLGHTYVPLSAPPGASPLYGISHTKGYAFSSPLAYSFRPFADDKLDDQGSPVMLYEDNKPLGPAHSDDLDIERIGKGRYSYRKGVGLIFSTSDNSDPAANGRHYWVDCPNKSPLTSELRCDP